MKVLFFAQIREFTGCDAIDFRTAQSATAVWTELEQRFPGIAKFRSTTRLARNGEFAKGDETFDDNDEIALIPPVSGG